MMKIPELALTEDESKALADAITGVSEHYDVPLMDDKSAAWLKLVMVGGSIYGTRMATMVMNKKAKPTLVPLRTPLTGPFSPPANAHV